MDRNSQSSPFLQEICVSDGSQSVDQGKERKGQFVPMEERKEMK